MFSSLLGNTDSEMRVGQPLTFCFVVNVLQNHPYYLHQGQDQSTKCQGAHMVPEM